MTANNSGGNDRNDDQGFEAEDEFVMGASRSRRPQPDAARSESGGEPDYAADEPEGDDGSDEGVNAIVERLATEVEQWKDAALRAKAEAENTKRRAERELNDGKAYAITRFAKDLLGVADNLSRALMAAPREDADPATKNLALGIEMTEKELIAAFERNGLKRIHPLAGDKFDPHVHQAVSEIPAEGVAPGSVAQVMQSGYELFGRVIRPAMVMVAAKNASAQTEGAGAYAKAAAATGDALDRKA